MQGAADAGHALLKSTNDVLLIEGPLSVTLLTRVERMQLPASWHASAAAASAEQTIPTTCQPDKEESIAAGPAGSSSTIALCQEVKESPAKLESESGLPIQGDVTLTSQPVVTAETLSEVTVSKPDLT